jgi:hypothetical protein
VVEKKERSKGKSSRWKRRSKSGQLSKRKKTPTDALEHLTENKEEQVGEALKTRVKWT